MLMTIERVLLLKSAGIFSRMPEDHLALLARSLQEEEVEAGEAIIKKGEMGTSMYIIANGKVKVHDDERTFAELGECEVFGELAALDPEPRSAHVTAVENSLLLRVEQETLIEALSGDAEILHGVIAFLCRRIRESAH